MEKMHKAHIMSNIGNGIPATIRIHRLTPAIKRSNEQKGENITVDLHSQWGTVNKMRNKPRH